MKKLKIAALVSLVLALVVVGAVLAATVTIDFFNNGTQSLSADTTKTTDTGFVSGSMLGGERDSEVTFSSGVRVDLDIYPAGVIEQLGFSQGSFSSQGTATIQWDGSDNSITLDPDGMSPGVDLTDSSSNDSLRLRIITNDSPLDVTFEVYTDATHWSNYTYTTPGSIGTGSVVDVIIPYTDFSTGGANAADFSDVGAIVLKIDGTVSPEGDLTLDLFESTSARDYGDLDATTYGIASHITDGLRLGDHVDAEASTATGTYASGDNTNGTNDEQGVARDMTDKWQNGATVDLNVTVKGCSGTCYFNGWIDWNGTGGFGTGEQVFTNQTVTNGVNTLQITVPASGTYTVGDPVYNRFRLCSSSGACTSTTGNVTGGEVEDYWWDFGPTAVVISSLDARSPWLTSPYTLGAAVLLLVMAMGGLVVARRRKA